MTAQITFVVIVILAVLGYGYGRVGAVRRAGGDKRRMNALPNHYGLYVGLWAGLPTLVLYAVWIAFEDVIIRNLVFARIPDAVRDQLSGGEVGLMMVRLRDAARGEETLPGAVPDGLPEYYVYLTNLSNWMLFTLVAVLGVFALVYAYRRVGPSFFARQPVERMIMGVLMAFACVAIATTVGIVLSMLFEAIRFFNMVSIFDFLFGLEWSPHTAIREDQAAAEGKFGAVPLFAGTFLITLIAMAVAIPVGLFAAIYLSEYANKWVRNWAKPIIEVLAGVPTVVYGFFALIVFTPTVDDVAEAIGLEASSANALGAGMVMGIMIIPFISSLSDDALNAVPQALRDGAYALGATQAETIRRVVLPAALPGIVGAILLAVSRGVGETMIVVMGAGLAANLTANPLDAVTTVTVQIVDLLTGDTAFDSAKTLSAFGLGLTLFVVTLILNVIALHIVRRYRDRYE